MNFFPFHIGDYLVATRHLSLLEDLAYRRCLDLYYTDEAPLPDDPQGVARKIAMREHATEVAAVLSEFFIKTPAGWSHARCDEEIERMRSKQRNARDSVAKRIAHASVTQASSTNTNTSKEKEKTARGSRLPPDWGLDEELTRFAIEQQVTPSLEILRFHDYWRAQPGQKGVKLDWPATWRNWCRNAKKNPADVARVTAPPPKQSSYLAEQAAHRAAVEAERIARKQQETA